MRKSYLYMIGSAKAGAAVEPVIFAQFVNLDAPPVGGRLMRHRVCHHRRLVVHGVGGKGFVGGEEVGRDVEVLLEGEFGVGVAEEGESRHFARLRGPAQRATDTRARYRDGSER